MLLAIDVGNTHTVFGAWSGDRWVGTWRRRTDIQATEDEIAAWLRSIFELEGLPWQVDGAVCGSVVLGANDALAKMCRKWLRTDLKFLREGKDVGIVVEYQPPHAVGADRLANALAVLAKYPPPIIVVDFGTATTFDSIGATGAYLGGAIMPGVKLSSQALFDRATRLPSVEFLPPTHAVGRTTSEPLQAGIMFGYAGSVDALARKINVELGGNAKILATGGLGGLFMGISETIEAYEPQLTLDGLVIAYGLMA